MHDAMLTIDLGTTRLKVAAFDQNGALLHQETARHGEHRDGAFLWQDANAWWADTQRLVGQSTARLGQLGRRVIAVSLSGRGGAAVFADGSGEVLAHPWSDDRHRVELRELRAWRRSTAQLSEYGAALLSKCMWLIAHEPQLATRVARVFYGKDFLLYRLTGAHLTDPSSGPDTLSWDSVAIEHARVSPAWVPSPALPWHIAGGLTGSSARALGLPSGLPVVVGGHDGICANVGAGAARSGDYAITLGTHAVVRVALDHTPEGARRFYGLPPSRHMIGGNAFLAGRAADWFVDITTEDPIETRDARFQQLDQAASTVPIGARGVSFMPFLAGRVAPEARPRASGAFVGMRVHHARADLYRALLEGSACAIRAVYEQIYGWCGAPRMVRLTGGGVGSATWTQLLAELLHVPLDITDSAVEGRGAAIFATVALGLYPNYEEAADHMVHVTRRVAPDAAAEARYDAVYRHWLEVERATRALDVIAPP